MSNNEDYLRKKQDNELVYIFMHANNYQPEFIALVEEELICRGISLDDLREKRGELKDRPPVRKKEIGGWLTFFLFVGVGLGALISVAMGIKNFSIYDYDIGLGRDIAIR